MDSLLFQSVLIRIDDLLVYLKSFSRAFKDLGETFERLRKFDIMLNPKKSDLFPLHVI
jgi:hypothetical protein